MKEYYFILIIIIFFFWHKEEYKGSYNMSEGVEKKQDNEIDETNELNNLLTNDKPSNVKEAEKNNDRKKNKEEVINNENEKDNIKKQWYK